MSSQEKIAGHAKLFYLVPLLLLKFAADTMLDILDWARGDA